MENSALQSIAQQLREKKAQAEALLENLQLEAHFNTVGFYDYLLLKVNNLANTGATTANPSLYLEEEITKARVFYQKTLADAMNFTVSEGFNLQGIFPCVAKKNRTNVSLNTEAARQKTANSIIAAASATENMVNSTNAKPDHRETRNEPESDNHAASYRSMSPATGQVKPNRSFVSIMKGSVKQPLALVSENEKSVEKQLEEEAANVSTPSTVKSTPTGRRTTPSNTVKVNYANPDTSPERKDVRPRKRSRASNEKSPGTVAQNSAYHYVCPEVACGQICTSPSSLSVHQLTHTGERPHACEECGKAFTLKSTLKNHLRTHTGEMTHYCSWPGCTYQAKQSPTVINHIRVLHFGLSANKKDLVGQEMADDHRDPRLYCQKIRKTAN